MNELILVVDDEPKIVRLARDYLEQSGFRIQVASDGATALAAARQDRPDLVVLDLNLPGMDGLDVCRALRRTSNVPIIMLTARAEEMDRLIGLELGADDYIVKPFSPRELVARVRAVLRRTQGDLPTPEIIRSGDLEIDLAGHHVTLRGAPLRLTRIEFRLLAILAQHPGPDPDARPVDRSPARGGRRRIRPQHRRPYQELAAQAGGRSCPPALCGDGVRHRLPVRRKGGGMSSQWGKGCRPGAWRGPPADWQPPHANHRPPNGRRRGMRAGDSSLRALPVCW